MPLPHVDMAITISRESADWWLMRQQYSAATQTICTLWYSALDWPRGTAVRYRPLNYKDFHFLHYANQILFCWSNRGEWGILDVWHIRWRAEVHKGFCWGNLRKTDTLEQVVVDVRMILKQIFSKITRKLDCSVLGYEKWRSFLYMLKKLRVP